MRNLNDEAVLWPTATARDWKDRACRDANVPVNALLGRAAVHFRPAPMTDGTASRRILNPRFVEWLMGWPTGLSACDCSATELSRWQQRMRSRLSELSCRQDCLEEAA
jgi:hypothetical protein